MAKDFISFLDYSDAEITSPLNLADTLRDTWHAKRLPQNLKGKSVASIWDAEGFRNLASFELGIVIRGSVTIQIPQTLDEGESIQDVARISIIGLTQLWHAQESTARWRNLPTRPRFPS